MTSLAVTSFAGTSVPVTSVPGVADLAAVAGRFGWLLHAAGVPVTPASSSRFAAAVATAVPGRVDELYWLGRVTLVSDRQHLAAYDRVFEQVFGGRVDALDAHRNPNAPLSSTRPAEGAPPVTRGHREGGGHGGEPRPGVTGAPSPDTDQGSDTSDGVLAAASDDERLASKPFGECTPAELEDLRRLLGEFRLDPPRRRSRRTRLHPLGRELDLRATVRAAQRTAGDPLRQVHRRRRVRPRRVVLLADVSGSMESYGRAYLYLLHGAVRAVGSEAFVFATRLHRLTRTLGWHQPAVALSRAMSQAPDWSGGTRIGHALATFNDGHARRGIGRGAIVVIVSDGWERGDPVLLAREMRRLSLLAYRIIWVNPRRQSAAYQPLVGGMAAALPYVDTFLSGHSVRHLNEVVDAIRNAARSPRARRATSMPPPATTAEGTDVPPTSMQPDYGTVTKMSEQRRWDFTTEPLR